MAGGGRAHVLDELVDEHRPGPVAVVVGVVGRLRLEQEVQEEVPRVPGDAAHTALLQEANPGVHAGVAGAEHLKFEILYLLYMYNFFFSIFVFFFYIFLWIDESSIIYPYM